MEQNEQGSNTILKWLVGILAVIIIGLIGYIVYSKSLSNKIAPKNTLSKTTTTAQTPAATAPTTTPTATTNNSDWKTYENNTYSFSFQYPNDWVVRDLTSPNNTHTTGMLGFFGSNPKSVGEDSFLLVEVNSQDLSTIIAREKKIVADNPNEELVKESHTAKFDVEVTKIDIKNKTTGIISTKYIMSKPKGPNTYILSGESTDTTAIAKTANQMISTFQFTK